jgi:hypothetical protein
MEGQQQISDKDIIDAYHIFNRIHKTLYENRLEAPFIKFELSKEDQELLFRVYPYHAFPNVNRK